MFSKQKRIIQIISISFIFSILLSVLHYSLEELFFQNSSDSLVVNNGMQLIEEQEKCLSRLSSKLRDSLLSIRNSNSFSNYLDGDSSTLKELLKVAISSDQNIMQIRLIDEVGFEDIRIERENSGSKAVFNSASKLKNKSHRYYFQQSKRAELERVWFSSIDLNMEDGAIEVPHRPTLRAVLPFSRDGKFGGILIINYFMDYFLEELQQTSLYDVMLYDGNGFFISHYNSKHNWSYYGDKFTIRDELSKVEKLSIKRLDSEISNELYMALKIKSSYQKSVDSENMRQYIYVSIAIFISSTLLIYLIIKLYYRVVSNLENISKLHDRVIEASEVAKIGFWEFDPKKNGNIEWSRGVYSIFGLKRGCCKITFEKFLSYLSPEDRELVQREFNSSIAENRGYFITHKIVTDSGDIKYVEERAKHYFNRDGSLKRSVGSVYDVTDNYLQNEKYKTILNVASDGIHILDESGQIIEFSRSFAELLGYSSEEIKKLNIRDIDSMIPEDKIGSMINLLINSPRSFETKHRRKDGKVIDVQISAKGIELNGRRLLYASQRDIREQKEREAEILRQRDELQTIFNTALEGIVLIDKDGCYKKLNRRFAEIMGYSEEELMDNSCFKFTAPEYIEKTKDVYRIVEEIGHYENFERYCIVKSGERRRIKSSIALMPNGDEFIMTAMDNTELYNAYSTIERQAYFDELTDLHNRKSYNRDMANLIEKGEQFSFMIFDIDLFKSINDTYGHDIGDKVLIEISSLISRVLESEKGTLYRIGGEEFVIILVGHPISSAHSIAETVRESVERDLNTIEDRVITVSIGVTELQKDDDADSIFKRADNLLYRAKEGGRNRIEVSNSTLQNR
jgi:diguanylate cyclase (GGDEF)-like protein/PAS domain S-box-containing protein